MLTALTKHWRLALALLPLLCIPALSVSTQRPGFDAGCFRYDHTSFDSHTEFHLVPRNNGNATHKGAHPVTKGPPRLRPKSYFHVDGKHLPGVSEAIGDVGDSWAGLMPVSKDPKNKAKYFFWLWPPAGKVGNDTLTIWINGGPGCSSMTGMLDENGPFNVRGTPENKTVVTRNPHGWNQAGWIVYVDQPEGTGFSRTAKPSARNERDVAVAFSGFLDSFYETFTEMKGKKLYLTGESYAGYYVPNIASYIVEQGNKFGLHGIGIIDGVISDINWYLDIPVMPYLRKYNKRYFGFPEKLMAEFEKNVTEVLGLKDFVKNNLKFPAMKGPLHWPEKFSKTKESVWSSVLDHLDKYKPCFNIYFIGETCPDVSQPISGLNLPQGHSWLDRKPFKAAIHVNEGNTTFTQCSEDPVFLGNGDSSKPPEEDGTFVKAIQGVNKTFIWHGDLDFRLLADGNILTIQNTTWRGQQGFLHEPRGMLAGSKGEWRGTWHTERGLTWIRPEYAGHMIPKQEPELALKIHKVFLDQLPETALGHS